MAISRSTSSSLLSVDDSNVWNQYISDLYAQPEQKFRPNKGRDKSLRSMIDLHGMTVQRAFNRVREVVNEHWIEGSRELLIVTGKSGKIADEFPSWCTNIPCIRRIEPMVDSRGEVGAWILHLRKQ